MARLSHVVAGLAIERQTQDRVSVGTKCPCYHMLCRLFRGRSRKSMGVGPKWPCYYLLCQDYSGEDPGLGRCSGTKMATHHMMCQDYLRDKSRNHDIGWVWDQNGYQVVLYIVHSWHHDRVIGVSEGENGTRLSCIVHSRIIQRLLGLFRDC